MKKAAVIFLLVISFCFLLAGCFSKVMVLPDADTIGEAKTFTKDGITLVLTDKFEETKSEMGFDAYFTSDFCGVIVLKEEFSLEAGLAQKSLEDYINNVIKNNAHENVAAQNADGLWFYTYDRDGRRIYSYSYKGSDAFWIVQYICESSDAKALEDQIFLWAKSVEVN